MVIGGTYVKPKTFRMRFEPWIGATGRIPAQHRSQISDAKSSRDASDDIVGLVSQSWSQALLLNVIENREMETKTGHHTPPQIKARRRALNLGHPQFGDRCR